MKFSIRLLYLYLFSFIGLVVTVVGAIRLIQLGINVYIFDGADQYTYYPEALRDDQQGPVIDNEELKRRNETENKRQRQREVASSASMLIVGLPLYKYHWRLIKKENKKS